MFQRLATSQDITFLLFQNLHFKVSLNMFLVTVLIAVFLLL